MRDFSREKYGTDRESVTLQCTDGPPPLETRACEDVPSPLGEFWCLCTSHGKQLLLTALGMLVVGNTVRGPMHSVFWVRCPGDSNLGYQLGYDF
eukprot:SAG31_NODE_870_length_11338_cov_14.525047_8_plen_94_part_00